MYMGNDWFYAKMGFIVVSRNGHNYFYHKLEAKLYVFIRTYLNFIRMYGKVKGKGMYTYRILRYI
jgi:hypothetical protein